VPRTSLGLLVVLTIVSLGLARPTRAQTVQRSPAQELDAVRQALDAVATTSGSSSAARTLADIKRDVADLITSYTAQAGVSGLAVAGITGESWRLKFGIVSSDLRAVDGLDPTLSGQLQQVRAHLEAFYVAALGLQNPAVGSQAATPVQPAPGQPPAASPSGQAASNALALLDRIQTLLAGLVAKSAGDPPSTAGQVSVNRATLDEIQASVTQLRTMAASGGAFGVQ